jgi:hypothetical protein
LIGEVGRTIEVQDFAADVMRAATASSGACLRPVRRIAAPSGERERRGLADAASRTVTQ